MAPVVVHSAGWLAVIPIALVAIGFIVVASRLTRRAPRTDSTERPRGMASPYLRFPDLYRLFRIGPLAADRWPVLQSEANRAEDENLRRLRRRSRQKSRF